MTHMDFFVSSVLAAVGLVVGGVVAAISEAATVAIVIAVIGALSAVTSAYIANAPGRDVNNRIGEPNGGQAVVSMLTKILDGQTGQDARLAIHDTLFAKVDHRLNVLSASVDSIRHDCHYIRAMDESTAHKVDDIAGKVSADRRHSDHEGEAP
ncbi:MAG TPA: hypothetical protein PKE56_12555 [Acidimicrobiales bacterium]|nr:hypothetical protein [Acidimicrobiales bacterium]